MYGHHALKNGRRTKLRLTPHNQTKIIKTMDLSPKEIETVVSIVDKGVTAAQKALSGLITEETDVLTVLHRIGAGEAFSKQRDCFCLLSALRKVCPYNEKRNCVGCSYEISTRSTLFLLVSEYNRIIDLYHEADNPLEKAKYKNLLVQVVIPKIDEMLSVIKELYGEDAFKDYETLIKENTR